MNMRDRRITAVLLCLSLTLLFALGCALPSPVPADDGADGGFDEPLFGDGGAVAPVEPGAAVQAVDMTGRTVGLAAYAGRIVVLDAADCEILCALGGAELLAGRSAACDYPEAISHLPYVATDAGVDVELLLSLTPDLVVAAAGTLVDEELAAVTGANIPIALTDAQDIAGVYTAISLLGILTGKTNEANALVASMVTSFATLQTETREDGTKTVYFELSALENGFSTGGAILSDLARTIGLRNEFEDLPGYSAVTAEQVVGRNPDYIVVAAHAWEDGAALVAALLARDGWAGVDAIKNRAVFYMDSAALLRPGPRLIDAAAMLLEAVSVEPEA